MRCGSVDCEAHTACRSVPTQLWLLTSSFTFRLVMLAVCGSVSGGSVRPALLERGTCSNAAPERETYLTGMRIRLAHARHYCLGVDRRR